MANSEVRPGKVVKRSNSKKPVIEVVEVVDTPTADGSMSPDGKQQLKRAQGIVIDGKTYTCATCKTGHRVGICKHAKDRPMKPTHPPGRPPAGAPKKVVCDCPKNCSCAKKGCKCARNCTCTQLMYMLVYVPAPEEGEDVDEEKGEWKLGEQVTTDLKGNVLTPEEVQKRQQKKDAMKLQPAPAALTPVETNINNSDVEVKPVKSCCKHKETIASQNIAAQASPHSGSISNASAEGCNCGHSCTCAFCPQHPNNSTSTNVARQQAVYFANHQFANDQQIVPFLPEMPQGVSCMGGQPRFAISRTAVRPSFDDLQKTFPNPGYVIGYPIWSHRTDVAAFPMAPFPITHEHSFINSMGMTSLAASSTPSDHPIFYTPQLTPMEQPIDFGYSQDQFGIGNAFVASAGNRGWENNLVSPIPWTTELSNVTTPFNNIADQISFMTPLPVSVDVQGLPVCSTPHSMHQPRDHQPSIALDTRANGNSSASETAVNEPAAQVRSCSGCGNSSTKTDPESQDSEFAQYFTSLSSPPTMNEYPRLNGMV